jgi:predicted DNA-binding transcriptional regulator AlpA
MTYTESLTQQKPDRIVRTAEAVELSALTNVHLMRLEQEGKFPRRFKLNPDGGKYGAVGWRLSDIQKWIDQRAAQAEEVE